MEENRIGGDGGRGGTVRALAATAGLGIVYLAAAFLGLLFAIPPGNATAIWPASGIALAGVLFLGPRAGAGIFLGATLANLTTSVSLPVALAIGLGNTLEALVGAWLLRRKGRGTAARFRDARGVFLFTSAAMVASACAATVGVAALAGAGSMPFRSTGVNWITWWLGDVAGIVIVAPLLIALRRGGRVRATRARTLEAAVAALGLVFASQAAFGGLLAADAARDLLYLPLVLLTWLALRFDLRGVTAATLVMAAVAAWGTSRGAGAYGGGESLGSLLDLQVLMVSYAVAGLALAATVSRRRRAESALRRSRNRLVALVRDRTADLRFANDELRHEVKERTRLQAIDSRRLATALESAGEGIMITDPDATITHVNPAFVAMTGYEKADVVGKSPRLLKSGAHGAGFYRQLWETISSGGVWRGSFVDRKKDASLYDVDSTIAPILESDGSIDGYVAVTRDVTSRKHADRALRDSESRLRTVFEAASDGMLTVDEEGLIESANGAVREMFGRSSGELLRQPAAGLLLAEGCGFGPPLGVVREVLGRRADGSLFPVDLVVDELVLEGRRLLAGFLRDATARHAALASAKALLRTHEQLRLAHEIQQRLYPKEAPVTAGFDIAGSSQPAEEAGGDYFDFVPMAEGRLALVIGDVSGHGLGPALLMSQTRAYLRALLLQTQDAGDLLERLNAFLKEDCGTRLFVTLFLACLDPSGRRLTYASAGHQSFLVRADGRVETLAATGIPLGLMSRPFFDAPEVSLCPGDLLLMMTDGVEETLSPDGREMGRAAVLELVRSLRDRPSREIVEALRSAARAFSAGGSQEDDVTIIVARVLAPAA